MYHLVILIIICALSVLKVGLFFENKLFITFDGVGKLFENGLVFDSQEVVTHSPRLLAIFTMCYMGRMKYTGRKDTWCAVQFTVLRGLPAYIAISFFLDQLIRRQLCLTMDDIFFFLLHLMARHVAV